MENVGIYKPPQKNTDVIGDVSDSFQVDLSTGDLEVTQPAQDKLREIIEQSDEDVSAIRIYVGGGGCGGPAGHRNPRVMARLMSCAVPTPSSMICIDSLRTAAMMRFPIKPLSPGTSLRTMGVLPQL